MGEVIGMLYPCCLPSKFACKFQGKKICKFECSKITRNCQESASNTQVSLKYTERKVSYNFNLAPAIKPFSILTKFLSYTKLVLNTCPNTTYLQAFLRSFSKLHVQT